MAVALNHAALSIASAPWPAWWLSEALCIHRHESTDWHKTTTWQGYPSVDHGGMQISVYTWAAYAPHGYPSDPAAASPYQQLVVAYLIWRHDGDWREWQTAPDCNLV